VSGPNDTSVPRARRHAERLAEALGLTVRELPPVKVARSWRVNVEILRGNEVVGYGEGSKDTKTERSARVAWYEAFGELRAMTRDVISIDARSAANEARWRREDLIRRRVEVDLARAALEAAEVALVKAEAEDAAALAAVHRHQSALPNDRTRMVLVALYEVLP
jgi:hypothetical protein